ncbi:MAG: lysozyme inhibitor LprI family protein [Gammaproteobacteria bacterium]
MISALLPLIRTGVVLLLIGASPAGLAIDNPDAPDWLGDFEARSAQFEQRIQHDAKNQTEIIQLYAQYAEFLDASLNEAYGRLSANLGASEQVALKRSQRLWLQFRDAEFAFIDQNWTPANFGSSSALSRSAYRSQIVKNRVVQLLHYVINFPR